MTENAYAKINIGLDVLGRRDDGYHEVRMIMQSIGLCDILTIDANDGPQILISTDNGQLSTGEDNLIYKAAKLMITQYALPCGIKVHLKKNIPVAAGLAGGSTDAAATIRAMNRLFGLGLATDELARLGAQIGADVPYCIIYGTVLCEGIGEILTPLDPCPPCNVLLAKPEAGVSTAYVYSNLKLEGISHPDMDAMISGIRCGDINMVARNMGNVLETVTMNEIPVIGELKRIMNESGCIGSLMSGSGPTVFGLFETRKAMQRAYDNIRGSGLSGDLFMTGFYDPGR